MAVSGLEAYLPEEDDRRMTTEQQLSLSCKTLRIGSYEISPNYKVLVSGGKLRLVVPSVKEQSKLVTILIERKDIIRVIANFGEKPLIFVHLKADACKSIRESLKMKKKKQYFLDVKSHRECQKRICIVPSVLPAASANILRAMFENYLQEVDATMAEEIFELSAPKLDTDIDSSPDKSESVDKNQAMKVNTKEKSVGSEVKLSAKYHQLEDQLNSNELQKLIYKREIKAFNFAIAEIVKKYLSPFYKPRKVNPRLYQISSRAEYSNMAKMFSHKFREEIMQRYFDKHFTFQDIKPTKEDELDIKTQMEVELRSRLKVARTEFVGYSV